MPAIPIPDLFRLFVDRMIFFMTPPSIDSDSKTPLAASLCYVAIGSPDPAALASWHASVMGLALSRTSSGILGRGPGRNVFFKHGKRNTIASAGYAVKDAEALARLENRIRNESWPVERLTESTLFRPGALS